ncbi:hypothetical protein LUZ60_004755 [Juncus effusus]|nr:hypothetical protein LUZ60_004755 [Juncus effusus]
MKKKSKQEPTFVKILRDENFSSQLTISKAQLTGLNGKLCKIIYLKGQISRKLHRIKVESSELSVTLKEGWEKFAQKNTLQRDDILLFFHQELNLFNVIIYNNMAQKVTEKRGNQNEQETEVRIGLNNGCFGNNLEKGGPSRKSGKRKASSDSDESCYEIPNEAPKVLDISSDKSSSENAQNSPPNSNKEESSTDSDSSDPDSDSDYSEYIPRKRDKRVSKSYRIFKSNRRLVTNEEKKSTKRQAKKFNDKSKNPTFMKEMKEPNVYHTFSLTVPIDFGRKFLPKKSTEVSLKLAESEGNKNNVKVWQVNCHYTFSNNQDQWRFFSRWKDFVFENNLEESDCCVFELINREILDGNEMFEFAVHAFRVVKQVVEMVEMSVKKYRKG